MLENRKFIYLKAHIKPNNLLKIESSIRENFDIIPQLASCHVPHIQLE